MNRQELVNEIATRTGKTKKDTALFVDTLEAVITDTLVSGEDVKLTGFINYTIKNSVERIGRNLQTGESVTIPARKKAKAKFSNVVQKKVEG